MLPAHSLTLEYKSSMEDGLAPMIFSAVLTVCCSQWVRWQGWGGGSRGWRWLCDVWAGAGEGCEVGLFKSTVKHIQFIGQLMGLHSVGGWSPVAGDVLQAPPHWRRVVGWELVFQLFRVAPLCYSDLFCRCVSLHSGSQPRPHLQYTYSILLLLHLVYPTIFFPTVQTWCKY